MLAGGHSVHTVAPAGPAWVTDTLAEWGAHHHVVELQRAGLNPLKDLAFARHIIRLCRELRPDVLLAYTVKPVVYGALAGRWCGVPTIATMVTGLGFAFMPVRGWRHALTRGVAWLLYKSAMHSAHCVFFQNPDDRADFQRLALLNRRLRVGMVNGSGVNLDHYTHSPLPEGTPRRVLLIARLLADKGVREYIEAARLVRKRHPDVVFEIIGPFDPNPAAIRKAEIEAAVQDGSVRYLGPMDDVRPALRGCHVYALPSYREGTPRSVLEAMAMGRPVVTTDAPGCRETVVDGLNGRMVPPRNAQALANALDQMLTLDRTALQRMGNEARRMAEEKYDVHRVNRQLMEPMGLC
ncbi:MAG: glycosyltransferase family 1 protein [Rhodobacteraceae bacterium PARR1]|nr:MAG: glycosyltransferase family 1 protein [Rhodobacteraceae bacterium PARR1]